MEVAMAHDPNGDGDQALMMMRNAWFDVEKEDSGSYRLVVRCRREYGWRHDWALKVLEGYRQFLTLHRLVFQQEQNQPATATIMASDNLLVDDSRDDEQQHHLNNNNCSLTKLIPSVPIHKMWKQHVLDMTHYSHDCQTCLVGRLVPFDADDIVEVKHCETPQQLEDYQRRILQTRQALEAHFSVDQIHPHVWKNVYLDSLLLHTKNKATTTTTNNQDEMIELNFFLDHEVSTVAVMPSVNTSVLTLLVFRNVPLQRVFRRLGRRLQIVHSKLKFVNTALGNTLVGSMTPELMGWYGEHDIQVLLKSDRLFALRQHPRGAIRNQPALSSIADEAAVNSSHDHGGGGQRRVPQSWTAAAARRLRLANQRATNNTSSTRASNATMMIPVEISKDHYLNVKCPLLGRMKRVYIKLALELNRPLTSFRLFQNGIALPHTKRIKTFNLQAGKLTIQDAQTQDDNEVMLDQFATTTLSEQNKQNKMDG